MTNHDPHIFERAARLVEARKRAGFESPTEAMRRFRWPATYYQHERGERGLTPKNVRAYAKAYKVSPGWLLTGEGPDVRIPVVGRVGASADGAILFNTGQGTTDFVPAPPGGSVNAVAVEVSGQSMRGLADDGSLIYFEDRRDPPTDDMFGEVVVVGLSTDEVLIKRLLRPRGGGLFDLQSIDGSIIPDAAVTWAAHVIAIVPPRQARKILIRGDV